MIFDYDILVYLNSICTFALSFFFYKVIAVEVEIRTFLVSFKLHNILKITRAMQNVC